MASRLATSFKDISGNTYVVQLHDSLHSGAETKYVAGKNGFLLNYESEDVIYPAILSSQCTIEIYIQDTNRTVINAILTDIAESDDENRFTIVVYQNSALYWRGKVQSERISIPDQHIALITMQANDGFGRLKSIPYDDAGTLYGGWETVSNHLTNILKKLDLFLLEAFQINLPYQQIGVTMMKHIRF